MPYIKLTHEALMHVSQAFNLAAGHMESINNDIARLVSSLEWQVRAQGSVENMIMQTAAEGRKLADVMHNMSRYLNTCVDQFTAADNAGAKSIQQPVTTLPVKTPFVPITLIGGAIGGLIGGGRTVIGTAIDWIRHIIGVDSSNVDANSGDPESTTITDTRTSEYGGMKSYTGAARNFNGQDYSRYSVLDGYQDEYSQKQSIQDIHDGNCTSTACAIAKSINSGKTIVPGDGDWKDGKGATWAGTKIVQGYAEADHNTKLNMIGEQLTHGNAVVVRANSAHTVAAIGLKNGANLSNLSASDILIVDPWDGMVKTLDQAVGGGCTLPSGANIDLLRIPS